MRVEMSLGDAQDILGDDCSALGDICEYRRWLPTMRVENSLGDEWRKTFMVMIVSALGEIVNTGGGFPPCASKFYW